MLTNTSTKQTVQLHVHSMDLDNPRISEFVGKLDCLVRQYQADLENATIEFDYNLTTTTITQTVVDNIPF